MDQQYEITNKSFVDHDGSEKVKNLHAELSLFDWAIADLKKCKTEEDIKKATWKTKYLLAWRCRHDLISLIDKEVDDLRARIASDKH